MCWQVAVVRSGYGFLPFAAIAMLATSCASVDECAGADAGPPDAGQSACEGEVTRAADDALEPTHVIEHVEDMLP